MRLELHHNTILASAATVAIAASALVASPATASARTPAEPPRLAERTVQALYDATDPRTHVFDGGEARASGVEAGLVDDYATGFAATGGSIRGATVDSARLSALRAAGDVRACSGRTRSDYTGAQLNVYLSSCNTNRLLAVIGGGTGVVGTIAGILAPTGLGAAAAGALAGVLAVAGAFLGVCAAKGRGTVIHNIPPSTITWCNSQ